MKVHTLLKKKKKKNGPHRTSNLTASSIYRKTVSV